jgi:hypothetical protein
MSYLLLVLSLLVGSPSLAAAQTAGGPSGASPSGTAATGSLGSKGGTVSSGHTITGTGGAPDTDVTSTTQGAVSHGNAVDTPAANRATNNLGNTDTGIIKK